MRGFGSARIRTTGFAAPGIAKKVRAAAIDAVNRAADAALEVAIAESPPDPKTKKRRDPSTLTGELEKGWSVSCTSWCTSGAMVTLSNTATYASWVNDGYMLPAHQVQNFTYTPENHCAGFPYDVFSWDNDLPRVQAGSRSMGRWVGICDNTRFRPAYAMKEKAVEAFVEVLERRFTTFFDTFERDEG